MGLYFVFREHCTHRRDPNLRIYLDSPVTSSYLSFSAIVNLGIESSRSRPVCAGGVRRERGIVHTHHYIRYVNSPNEESLFSPLRIRLVPLTHWKRVLVGPPPR